jgi:hypothetical protein
MLESGQQIHYPETLMTQDFINKIAKDLIRMCDAVEKHGLVDYQYGFAEEQIIMSKFFLKNVHIEMKVDLIFQFFRNAWIFKSQERALSKTLAWTGYRFEILFNSHFKFNSVIALRLRGFFYVILYYNRWTTICM